MQTLHITSIYLRHNTSKKQFLLNESCAVKVKPLHQI